MVLIIASERFHKSFLRRPIRVRDNSNDTVKYQLTTAIFEFAGVKICFVGSIRVYSVFVSLSLVHYLMSS